MRPLAWIAALLAVPLLGYFAEKLPKPPVVPIPEKPVASNTNILPPAKSLPGYFTLECGEGNGPIVGKIDKVAFLIPPSGCWTEWVTFQHQPFSAKCDSTGALTVKFPDNTEYIDNPSTVTNMPPLPRQLRFKNLTKEWVSYTCSMGG